MNAPTVYRSLLFVPGNRPERFAKTLTYGADFTVIDLEDAVAPDAKAEARTHCQNYLADGGRALVRVNGLSSEWGEQDLVALGQLPNLLGVILPKTESIADIYYVSRYLNAKRPIFPLIETAIGMVNVFDIAKAPQVARLIFGSVDFSLDLAIEGDDDFLDLYRAQLVLASRAARLQPPIDGVCLDIHAENVLQQAVARARRQGFGGKLCIHPSQVMQVNAGFMPSAQELAWAGDIIRQAACHRGVFLFKGKMVDEPVLERARRLLQYGTVQF